MPRAPLGYGKEDHFVKKGFQLHGVVHVGMNDGEEITWYWHVGRLPVLGFEPIKEAYDAACENYAPEIASGKVNLINMALGSKDHKLVMAIPLVPGIGYETKGATGLTEIANEFEVKYEEVPCVRFDHWYESWGRHDISIIEYDTLVIDVQGMELQVLKGFGKYLDNFKFLMIECSETPWWEGEASGYEVSEWLAHITPLRMKTYIRDSNIVEHNDVMFIRSDLL